MNDISDVIETSTVATQRIEWADIFKALCIICMVIGHTTAIWNTYIYQFHMAAFFFISGYTSNIWKHDEETLVFRKLYGLILPLLTMILLLSITFHLINEEQSILDAILSTAQDYKNFFIHVTTVNLLGASWFLIVLFEVFLVQRIIYAFTNKYGGLTAYLLLTIAIYFFGRYLNSNGFLSPRMEDITLIVQLFFGAGVFLRLIPKEAYSKFYKRSLSCLPRFVYYLMGAVLCLIVMVLATKMNIQVTMDIPVRTYPNVIIMMILPFAGIGMMYFISKLISMLKSKLKKAFLTIGQETLGILFLHFTCFKIATLLLIPTGKTTISDLELFLPPDIVSANIWYALIYVTVSIIASILIWKILRRIPYFNILLGKSPRKTSVPKQNG